MGDEDKDESWKDTNVGLIGSDVDKQVRKAAALTEPAWEGAGSAAGIQIWRIEQFHVVPVPKETYGKFHEGDSYICLQTIEDPESSKLTHKIFFWLGKDSSTDERGTAAYKTVELDDLLDQEPSEHRESQRQGESEEFKALFGGEIEYLEGGCPSGFHHVVPDGHENKLYQVRKVKKKVSMMRVPLKTSSIHPHDCYILDAEKAIYVLDGPEAPADEKFRACEEANKIENQREGHAKETHDIDDGFWQVLEGEKPSWFGAPPPAAPEPAAAPAPAPAPAADPAPAAAPAPAAEEPAPAPVAASPTGTYSLQDLKDGCPPGVEPSAKEEALNDADFQSAFGMPRADFQKMPKWKQQNAKKSVGIF